MSEEVVTAEVEDKEYDIYRDSLVRYCGYANEVGESFRPVTNTTFVLATYGISMAYVFADSLDKAKKAPENDRFKCGGDAFLWQSLASVAIPGFTIHQVVKATKFGVGRMSLPSAAAKWAPTFVGLASIPFIIHPIDHLVHVGMDATTRKWMGVPPHY